MSRAKPLEGAKPSITVLAGIALLGALLWVARDVLIPVALGVLISFILTPAVLALQRRGLSRTASVTLVSLVALTIVAGGVVVITAQLHDLATDLPSHHENILQKIKSVKGSGPGLLSRWQALWDDIIAILEQDAPKKGGLSIPVKTVETTENDQLETFAAVAYPVVKIISMIGLVIALTVTMLFKREDLRNRLIRIAGQGQLTSTTRAIDEATRRISSYLALQVALNAGFGIVFSIGLWIIGVPYALLWGVMAAALRFVPYVGTWLAAVCPLIVSVAVSHGWGQPIAVILFTLVVGLTLNNVLEPLWVSRSTGVSPIALIIAAAFWTWLWGPIGLILSTPMTVCLGVLGRYVPALSFLHVLLGTDPALDPQHGYYQRLLARDELEATDLVATYLQEHSRSELCDNVIIPNLVRVREHLAVGKVDQEEVDYVRSFTEELLDDELGFETETPNSPPVTIVALGCPAKDAIDGLALQLFRRLHGNALELQVLEENTVVAQVVDWVHSHKPAAALIGAVPPGGLGKIRYLCKRLRNEFPELVIFVGYWGLSVDESKLLSQLKGLGADHLATSMSETLDQFVEYLDVPEAFPPNTRPDEEKPVDVSVETRIEVKVGEGASDAPRNDPESS